MLANDKLIFDSSVFSTKEASIKLLVLPNCSECCVIDLLLDVNFILTLVFLQHCCQL